MNARQAEDVVTYAEYLVWVAEVDTGFVDCYDAEELIEGYWMMYPVPNGEATRAIATSPGIYGLFLEWRRRR